MQVIQKPGVSVGSWVNVTKGSGFSGTLRYRYEENSKIIRVEYDMNKAGAMFRSGYLGTIPISPLRDLAFTGTNKVGQGGEWHSVRVSNNGSFNMLNTQSGGDTQDARGTFTYPI